MSSNYFLNVYTRMIVQESMHPIAPAEWLLISCQKPSPLISYTWRTFRTIAPTSRLLLLGGSINVSLESTVVVREDCTISEEDNQYYTLSCKRVYSHDHTRNLHPYRPPGWFPLFAMPKDSQQVAKFLSKHHQVNEQYH
jgi:hypothetical protein